MRESRCEQVHLVGVAGVGMSALAQAMVATGYVVSGSDRQVDSGGPSEDLRKLEAAGVRLVPQDGSGVTAATNRVIVSTAIEADNPDLCAAEAYHVPVRHRAEALAELIEGQPCIAISGTSGKSTVTGMVGWVLECVGAEPTVVNGAPVLNWRDEGHIGNVRIPAAPAPGAERWWVIEADESDRSLVNFHPDWAVITNISHDHFSTAEAEALFRRFGRQARAGVINMPETDAAVPPFMPGKGGRGSRFTWRGVEFTLQVPGQHNVENAVCCITVCQKLGCPLPGIRDALSRFEGIARRLEYVGQANGVLVVDDYAHNPAKIRASWRAMASAGGRVIAVWRPHGFGPLRLLMEELIGVFREVMRTQDRLFILPVYDAGGTADRRINSDELVTALEGQGCAVEFVAEVATLPARIADVARDGDVVLTMGARDPELPALARRILEAVGG